MKTSFAVLALLASASAFAMPSVGDDALYDVTVTSATQSAQGTTELTLKSFDASTNQWDEGQVVSMTGQPQKTQDNMMAASDLLTDAVVQQVLQACASQGGSPESVTVPAGTFNTCAVSVPAQNGVSQKLWVAAGVAFGMAQMEIDTAGVSMLFKLHSSKLGQ